MFTERDIWFPDKALSNMPPVFTEVHLRLIVKLDIWVDRCFFRLNFPKSLIWKWIG